MAMFVLEKVRKLNWLLQESTSGSLSFYQLCGTLSDLMDTNVYIADSQGRMLGIHNKIRSEDAANIDSESAEINFPGEYNTELLKISTTQVNLTSDEAGKFFKNGSDSDSALHTIMPIFGGGERLGTLVYTRSSPEFNDEDLVIGEYGSAIVCLELKRREAVEKAEETRKRQVVQMAIGTLSYSETEAMQRIFEELKGREGLLIASKVADRSGITRSVIVNALRKLESAAVIESRSLGMKGTHIKILNDKFLEELQKISI